MVTENSGGVNSTLALGHPSQGSGYFADSVPCWLEGRLFHRQGDKVNITKVAVIPFNGEAELPSFCGSIAANPTSTSRVKPLGELPAVIAQVVLSGSMAGKLNSASNA